MKAVRHTAGFDISQPVEQVFPLFSPEGEKRWVPGWDYVNVMGTTELSEGYVFLTRGHDHATTDAIWLVNKYLPEERLIQFYRVEPEDKVGVVTVRCSGNDKRTTHVAVTYEYIALSEKGRRFIDGFTTDVFRAFIDDWKKNLILCFDRKA